MQEGVFCSNAPTEWETRTLISVSVSTMLLRTKTASWGGISIVTTVSISSQENNKEQTKIESIVFFIIKIVFCKILMELLGIMILALQLLHYFHMTNKQTMGFFYYINYMPQLTTYFAKYF